ncbi:hypothetical protein D3C75_1273340 [compost metagenome]
MIPPLLGRSVPPGTITSNSVFLYRICATRRLLVMMRRWLWFISARATCSTVVPMVIKMVERSGM